MEDVQSHAPQVALNIDRVGVRELKLPLLVRDRCQGKQQTVATVDLGVDLPSSFKGTHMSRFVEALEQWNDEISYQSVRRLLVNIKTLVSGHDVSASLHSAAIITDLPAPVGKTMQTLPVWLSRNH